jgi:serine/threonine protein kinase
VKLCDFGISMTLDKMITSLYTDKYLGTGLYMDRDLIDKFENILVCKEMDVYSLEF